MSISRPAPPPMAAADWLMLALLSVLWGGSFIFVALAVHHLPALVIVWLRVALAAGALGIVLAVIRLPLPPRRAWPSLLVMGVLNNAVPFTLLVMAQGQIGAGLAAILNATTPLFTLAVAAAATRDEALTLPRIGGLLAGFAGVAVMMGGAGGGTLAAHLACLGAALSYAFAGVFGRRFTKMGLAPLATAFGMLSASVLLLAPLVLIFDRPWTLTAPALPVWGAIAALALLSTALAYIIFFRLLSRVGAVNLALVTFLIPVSALALGVTLLGETVALRQLAGLAGIAFGLALIDGRLFRR